MKRCCVAFFVLILALSMATMAAAQENKLAFFDIDSDIATAGFQGGKVIDGIGGGKRVGFAIYVKNVDQLQGASLDVTWDGTKAEKAGETGPDISIDDREVNGADVTASETNALGSILSIPIADEAGHFAVDFTGTALESSDYGLLYAVVLRTDADFTTNDNITVTVKVTVVNSTGVQKELGSREFYVNGTVDVKTSSWGEIKNQFKD
jgi:hypothetical protein